MIDPAVGAFLTLLILGIGAVIVNRKGTVTAKPPSKPITQQVTCEYEDTFRPTKYPTFGLTTSRRAISNEAGATEFLQAIRDDTLPYGETPGTVPYGFPRKLHSTLQDIEVEHRKKKERAK